MQSYVAFKISLNSPLVNWVPLSVAICSDSPKIATFTRKAPITFVVVTVVVVVLFL